MASGNGSKINQLLKKWPSGTVAVSRWLEKQGAYQQLVHEYEKASWLRRIGQGAYAKSSDKVEWPGGLFALQDQDVERLTQRRVHSLKRGPNAKQQTADV